MMRGGEPSPLVPDVYTQDLLSELPVLRKIADIETTILCNLDSSDMQPHHWVALAQLVHQSLARYDGIVVIHGTDTMAYTASALSFLLRGLDRPVMITGAQKPLKDVRTDGRTNLVDACHLATMAIPEVAIVFDSLLLRGCRATKLDAWGMSAFGSPACPPLAELGLGVQLAPHVLKAGTLAPFDSRLDERVLAVRTFPGLDPKLLLGAIEVGVRGMLIEAFGAGNIPRIENSLIPVLERAKELDIPVVIASQCPRGSVDLARYVGGLAAATAGAISARDMTTEAALTKLMITLGRTTNESRVATARSAFAETWAGEMSGS